MKKLIVICSVLFVVGIVGVAAVVLPIVARTKEAALKLAAEQERKVEETEETSAGLPEVVPLSGDNDSQAGIDDPREMVQGIVNALAANDYEAFTRFTCLGMKKEEFKEFMNDNGDRKVIRVWDRAKDDFQAELKTNMHEAFLEILEEAQEEGFDWSQARVVECEFSDDVKAELVAGSPELGLHLDDCFVTPRGLLMFDAPRAR